MKKALLVTSLLGLLTLGGCAGGGVGVSYRAYTAPPPLRVETRGFAPGPDYFWVNGYWGGGNGGYAWVPGQWSRRPRPRAVWVEPRWERRGREYRFHPGRWR